mgnify:FL=1
MTLERASRVKRGYEQSESIFVVAFACAFFKIKIESGMRKKLALRTERKRSSIEFEQSENIGQFFMFWAFNYF